MVRPKKHLGQHFLIDETIAQQIVAGINRTNPSQMIEVGSGTGVLTKYLVDVEYPFEALDVDQESVDYLKKTYPHHSNKFKYSDFLKNDIESEGTLIIGNFPYNISSQIFFKVWECRDKIDQVVCMIQKEVAERIAAPHGNKTYGILSVLLQAFYSIEYLFTVPPEAFNPPPKVHSGVIRLTRNETVDLGCDEKLLKRVVKMGFGKRRKTLRNALKELDLQPEATSQEVFSRRAEQLSVAEFVELTSNIEKWKAQ